MRRFVSCINWVCNTSCFATPLYDRIGGNLSFSFASVFVRHGCSQRACQSSTSPLEIQMNWIFLLCMTCRFLGLFSLYVYCTLPRNTTIYPAQDWFLSKREHASTVKPTDPSDFQLETWASHNPETTAYNFYTFGGRTEENIYKKNQVSRINDCITSISVSLNRANEHRNQITDDSQSPT